MSVSTQKELKMYCNMNYFYSKKNITHVFLDKGSISIPESKLSSFYDCCAWNICHGLPISVVEQRSIIFKMFMDIDYVCDGPLDKDTIINITKNIQTVMTSILDSSRTNNFQCIVSMSPPKELDNGNFKNGIHINWVGLYVDKLLARKIRDIIIQKLLLDVPEYPWDKMIDESVYVGSGFRMMFSDKTSKCISCNGRKRKFCQECLGKGMVYSRQYKPVISLDARAHEQPLEEYTEGSIESIKRILILTSIRSNVLESNCVIKEPIGAWYIPIAFPENGMSAKRKTPQVFMDDPAFNEEKGMKMGTSDERIDSFDPRFIATEEYLNTWKYYSGLTITSMVKYFFRGKFYYHIRSDQHYCHNIKMAHRSNHVWFRISSDPQCIEQRCFDTESCKGYSSSLKESFVYGKKLKTLLFPEELQASIDAYNKSIYKPKEINEQQDLIHSILFNNDLI